MSDGDGDGGGGGGDGDGDIDAGPDAGPELDLRVIFTAQNDQAIDLFAADVIGGQLEAARPLNGAAGSSPVSDSFAGASADGSAVFFRAGDPIELYMVGFEAGEPTIPVRISGTGEGGHVLETFIAPDGRHVVYGRGERSTTRLQYMFVDLSGSGQGEPVPLAAGDSLVLGGVLSADGATFVFLEDGAAYAVDVSGSTPSVTVRISPPSTGTARAVRLSDDGSRAAIVGDLETSGVQELFVVDLSGPSPAAAQKASGPLVAGGDVSVAQLHSDGDIVAYLADANTDGLKELFVVDLSGASPGPPSRVNGQLTGGGVSLPTREHGIKFSPDGTRIAYIAEERAGVFELFLANIGETAQRVSGSMPDAGDASAEFAFTPDGSGLVYLADPRTDNVTELFYVDLRGALPAAPRRVNGDFVDGGGLASDFGSRFSFSPDGSQLAYRADAVVAGRFELFVAPIVDGIPGAGVSVQEPAVADSQILPPLFSADGGWLAYVGSTEGATQDLWLVDLRAGAPAAAQRVGSNAAGTVLLRPGIQP